MYSSQSVHYFLRPHVIQSMNILLLFNKQVLFYPEVYFFLKWPAIECVNTPLLPCSNRAYSSQLVSSFLRPTVIPCVNTLLLLIKQGLYFLVSIFLRQSGQAWGQTLTSVFEALIQHFKNACIITHIIKHSA